MLKHSKKTWFLVSYPMMLLFLNDFSYTVKLDKNPKVKTMHLASKKQLLSHLFLSKNCLKGVDASNIL